MLETFSEEMSWNSSSYAKLHLKYTKEILKNKKENIGQRDVSVLTP